MDKKFVKNFYNKNKNLPHISNYHVEDYYQHVMLVLGNALADETASEQLIEAAALHDIGKPETFGYNKKGFPCFYGHEKSGEAMKKASPSSAYVEELINAHMLPFAIEGPEPYASKAREALNAYKARLGEKFIEDVYKLHSYDMLGTIRPKSDSSPNLQLIQLAEKWFRS